MKKIYLSMLAALALNTGMNAQTACSNGRYSSDVYSTYTVTSGIAYGKNVTFSNTTQTLTLDFYEKMIALRQPLFADRNAWIEERRLNYQIMILPLSEDGERISMIVTGIGPRSA